MRARRTATPVGTMGWRVILSLVSLAMGTGLGTVNGAPMVAQPTGWECPAPASAASPTAEATPVAAIPPSAFPDGGGELTVFAAASLTDAFEQMKVDLEAAHPGLSITYNFGGSQALVTQLAEGAHADVFASANLAQMDAAREAGLIAGEPVVFVRNRLAIVVPADNPAGIASPADLGAEGLRLVLAQAEVPVGRYARESVCRMGEDSAAYGEGFVERVAANVVSEEEDVRDVLAKVSLGEADAGIVYVTDAQTAGETVQVIEIPDAVNVVATYPVAVVAGGDTALGEAFIAYLVSEQGQSALASFGFAPVR